MRPTFATLVAEWTDWSSAAPESRHGDISIWRKIFATQERAQHAINSLGPGGR